MDYTNLYSSRIVKTYDEDQDDIFGILNSAFEKNPKIEITLLNYYKGMPVSFNAKIALIDRRYVDLDVSSLQAIAISTEYYTFIRSKLFKYDIAAKVQYLNIRRKVVSLKQLSYVEIMAERRNNVRLELDQPINALFMSPTGTESGKLIELSLGGAVLQDDKRYNVELGDEAKLMYILPALDQNSTKYTTVDAKVVRIDDNIKPIRYCFMCTTDKVTEKQISKYLFHRQIEIIRELKDHSDLE